MGFMQLSYFHSPSVVLKAFQFQDDLVERRQGYVCEYVHDYVPKYRLKKSSLPPKQNGGPGFKTWEFADGAYLVNVVDSHLVLECSSSEWANHLGPELKQRSFDSADILGVFNLLWYILPNKVAEKFIVCHCYQP